VLIKRSVNLSGHATSLALEPEFWTVLGRMAEGRSLAALIGELDDVRGEQPLASACRVAALKWVAETQSRAAALNPLAP
jgi:predicted DNA-binding ribbon-helix-helix protein